MKRLATDKLMGRAFLERRHLSYLSQEKQMSFQQYRRALKMKIMGLAQSVCFYTFCGTEMRLHFLKIVRGKGSVQ